MSAGSRGARLEGAGVGPSPGAEGEGVGWAGSPAAAAVVEVGADGAGLVVIVDGQRLRNVEGVRLRAGVAGHYHVELELAAARVHLPRVGPIDGAKG